MCLPDGLAGYQIEDICEDAEGYLWFWRGVVAQGVFDLAYAWDGLILIPGDIE
jgi:hypothetical protein